MKIKLKIDFGEIEDQLKDLKKELGKGTMGARAGYLEAEERQDGTKESVVALANEFGATITIPEKQSTVYKKIKDDGSYALGGRFVKRKKSNFAQDVVIPEHTVTIPPRPFMRNAREGLEKKLQKVVQSGLEREESMSRILMQCGIAMRNAIVESIDSNIQPGNAPSTIKRKGSSHTLIDTGQLRSSVQSSLIIDGKEELISKEKK